MSLSEKVEKLAHQIEELEQQLDVLEDYKQENRELEHENAHMHYLLRQLGIEDIWGDTTINSLSVADVMAIEKALQNVWAVR